MDTLNLSLRAVANPGDTILVETPNYFGLLKMIESFGMKVLGVPATCHEGIDLAAFKRALKKHTVAACILIPSFGNPHGAELPWRVDLIKLRDAAIKYHISICPGSIFSVDGEFQHFIRLNCALGLDKKVLSAIETLGRLTHDLNTPAKSRKVG